MAAQKAPDGEIEPFERTVNPERLKRVLGTGRGIAAGGRQHRRNRAPIKPDRKTEPGNREASQVRNLSIGHGWSFAVLWASLMWAAPTAVVKSPRSSENGLVSVPGRATRT